MGRELFFLFFAGVPAEDTGGFPLYPLGRWLFPLSICLLAVGFRMERSRASRLFAVIRYGKRGKWWTAHFCRHLLYGVLTGAALLASGLLVQLLLTGTQPDRQGMEAMAAVCILWIVHMMTLLALFFFMELFMKTAEQRNLIPPALLLLEGMSFLYGHYHREAARFMFGSWGMYTQSSLCDGAGYRTVPVLAAEAACIAGCCLLGYGFLAGREKETDYLWQV